MVRKGVNFLRPTLIEKMGIQSQVFELRKQGAGIRKIVEILKDRHSKNFNYYQVKTFLERNQEKMNYYLKEDPVAVEEAKKQLTESMQQFRKLNEEAWEYFNTLKIDGKMDIRRIKAMDTLLKIIKFYDDKLQRATGGISPKTVVQKTNIINLTQNIDKTISYFESKGMILVNRRDYEKLLEDNSRLKKRVGIKYGKDDSGEGR